MPDWRYILCKQPAPNADPTLPLERITWLQDAGSRTLNVANNRAGELGFQYPVKGKWAKELFKGSNCILAVRDGEEIWSGPLANNTGSSSGGSFPIKAVGWLDLLEFRELRADKTYGATNATTGLPWTDAEIIFDLINTVNAYDPAHATPLRPGTAYGTRYNRQKTWTKGTKLVQCFRDLMDIESGIDIVVNPSTRRVDVYSWDYYTTYANIVWGFNKPPFNVAEFSWSVDFMAIRNYMPLSGKGGAAALAQDTASQSIYGLREESVNLPDVGESAILLYYGGAEVALKSVPYLFYTFTPKAQGPKQHMLFRDFKLGDAMKLSVDWGPIQEDQRTVRCFGADISIDNVGTEKITSFKTLATA